MIMRTSTYILLTIFTMTGITGCKKFIDVNTDPNNPLNVQEALILAPLELDLSSVLIGGTNVGNRYASTFVNHWMQNVAVNQPVPNEGTYRQFNQDMNDVWSNIYVTCLNNLKVMN